MYRQNNRNSYGSGNRGRGNNSRRRKPSSLNPQMLIKKAVIKEESEQFIPSFTYDQLNIGSQLKSNILQKGYKNPTPIQDKTIPSILEGKDVVGIANTGTGKTAAFLIPSIERITKNRSDRLLVIAPTRELAEQIENEAYALTKNLNLRSLLIVGGSNINSQIGKLRGNPHIVVGTPGRLTDLFERGVLDLGTFNIVVLDEVDRMLDMGFINDIKYIISKVPAQRQSLFFSATMTYTVENVLNLFSKTYEKVSVKTSETSENVHQDIIEVRSKEEKEEKLIELLKSPDYKKVIVFLRTKHGVEKLDDKLYKLGFRVDALHGNKSQSQRKRALEAFKSDKAQVLIATDVAARGLDVKDISHVINYDMPETYEDYTHRIGRTGRASKIGFALTFVELYRD